jgi:predicted nucleotidyltransferase
MFEELLAKLAASLDRHRIPYMIIGGQAVLVYGEPRLTRDIDITLGVDVDRLTDILSIAQEASLKSLPDKIETFVKETMVLPAIDEATGIRVDFIFSYTPYEREAISRANKIKILNQEVCFASVEDVIIHKVFAGRARDIEDIKSILIKNRDIDTEYIRRWLKEFDTSLGEDRFLNTFIELLKEIS